MQRVSASKPPTNAQTTRFKTLVTSDADTLEAGLSPVIPGVRIRPLRGSHLSARLTATKLSGLGLFTTQFRNVDGMSFNERPYVGVTIPIRGVCRMAGRREISDVFPGMSHIAHGESPFRAQMMEDGCEFLGVVVDKNKFTRVFTRVHDEPPPQSALRECIPPGHPGAELLAQQACALWRGLRDGAYPSSHFGLREATDKLVCQLVEWGINMKLDMSKEKPDDKIAHKAADYIVANLDHPLMLSDIAANSHTSVRTLTRSFRRTFGTSPGQFIRDRRLEAVNRTLLLAEPNEVTVTETAMRFGFWHLGRFSGDYRRAFGEPPSSTLCKHP